MDRSRRLRGREEEDLKDRIKRERGRDSGSMRTAGRARTRSRSRGGRSPERQKFARDRHTGR